VLDDISLNVAPSGLLESGMTITISCIIRYGGPAVLSRQQDPTLELTLDNEPALPSGSTHYEEPAGTDSLHRKTWVILFMGLSK